MNVELTKSGKAAIATLYCKYMERVKNKEPKLQSRIFNKDIPAQAAILGSITDDLPELKAAGFIEIYLYGDVKLLDKAIIFMENKTADVIKDWLSFAAQFIP